MKHQVPQSGRKTSLPAGLKDLAEKIENFLTDPNGLDLILAREFAEDCRRRIRSFSGHSLKLGKPGFLVDC